MLPSVMVGDMAGMTKFWAAHCRELFVNAVNGQSCLEVGAPCLRTSGCELFAECSRSHCCAQAAANHRIRHYKSVLYVGNGANCARKES